MRASKEIAKRMRDMLTQDKVGVKQGFATALEKDVGATLSNYFQLEKTPTVNITQTNEGEYAISIEAVALRIKQFETTLEMKRF